MTVGASVPGIANLDVLHFSADAEGGEARRDSIAVEEPLEIRLSGEPLVVTMRTPGHDQELALGLLLAEGLIRSRADIGSISHCGRPDDEGFENTLEISSAPGFVIDPDRALVKRGTLSSAACGVCGRRTIDDLLVERAPLADGTCFRREAISRMASGLRSAQPNFELTGGLHAAALADASGHFQIVREDVGRHNAVDKVVGRLLVDGRVPAAGHILVVSGRASFEIVQKAYMAGIPAVVAVSAPSSLAVATAERAGITLVGFARSGSFNVYSGGERIV